MVDILKYAHVESERRFLVSSLPSGATHVTDIVDRYLTGTRLRLREATGDGGQLQRKLGHKVRLEDGPRRVACTSMYLDDAEWALLWALPGRVLRKRRHHYAVDGGRGFAVDALPDGSLLAEVDYGDRPGADVPGLLDVVREVTAEEAWTGARLAERLGSDA